VGVALDAEGAMGDRGLGVLVGSELVGCRGCDGGSGVGGVGGLRVGWMRRGLELTAASSQQPAGDTQTRQKDSQVADIVAVHLAVRECSRQQTHRQASPVWNLRDEGLAGQVGI